MAAPLVSPTPGTADLYTRAAATPPPAAPSAFQIASGAWMRDALARAIATTLAPNPNTPAARRSRLLSEAPILTPQSRASMYSAAAAAGTRARQAAASRGYGAPVY